MHPSLCRSSTVRYSYGVLCDVVAPPRAVERGAVRGHRTWAEGKVLFRALRESELRESELRESGGERLGRNAEPTSDA